jgi:hypothetical protein
MKENEADDWEKVLDWLLMLRQSGIAVVVVHHANRDGNGGKLPNNSRLATELMAIELNDRKEGRLMLQPKHKLSKSPDLADACALTMCKDGILAVPRRSSLSIRPMF